MTKKSRYLLLLAGFIAFLIAAPLMVLYVQGISVDFTNRSFIQTGILTAKTEPKDAEIYLNGELARKSNGSIRFLMPSEYKVEIKKEGYLTWAKRLKIQSAEVTAANPPFNNIYLFYQDPKVKTIESRVVDFYHGQNALGFLTQNDFVVIPADGDTVRTDNRHVLPKMVNKILAVDADENNFLLGDGVRTMLVFNADSEEFYDISSIVNNEAKMQLASSGKLYAQFKDVLYEINPQSKTIKPILSSVKAFFLLENDLYYIKEDAQSGLTLFVTPSPFSQNQTLINDIPQFSQGQLFVTFEKQIFLLGDGSLYRISMDSKKIQSNVSDFSFDAANSTLAVLSAGEFDYISGMDKNLNVVTRSAETIKNLSISHHAYYGFYLKNGSVTAVELDTRDTQNTYTLYSGQAEKFSVDDEAKNIWVLDGGELKLIAIR